jgi:RimJ/RimL family protein N-acetyltransferase
MQTRTRQCAQLTPLDSPELILTAARWLADKENYRWLQFGNGRHVLTPALLKVMTQKDTHLIRVYTSEDGAPIGIVGLDEVNRNFKTARIWVVAGEKNICGRGYATQAAAKLLTIGFRELGLHAVNTWIVEHNRSARIAERLGFKFIGRQRQCHWMDGVAYDRLWFDLLASEHEDTADD